MKRALLIASRTYGLTGMNHDLGLMCDVLVKMNFQITCLQGAEASRAGILDGFSRLLSQSSRDDAILVYYTGHGGRAINPDWTPHSNHARYLQFIVPTDMEESQPGDFRGIMDLELTWLSNRLCEKCPNVVFALDCCHAARLVRASKSRPKALPEPWTRGIVEHLNWLKAEDSYTTNASNVLAVRLTAAGASQSAYEDPSGEFGGYFTEALAEALDQVIHTPVSWAVIGRWVREQVLVMEPRQRPELEGPVERLLFSLETQSSAGSYTFFYDGDEVEIPSMRGGRLHGVATGNLYAVMDLDHGSRIATVGAGEGLGGISRVEILNRDPVDGSPLIALREMATLRRVALSVDHLPHLAQLLEKHPLLEWADPGAHGVMANITQVSGGICVSDSTGRALHSKPIGEMDALKILSQMARACAVREISETPQTRLTHAWAFEWGLVKPGRLSPLGTFPSLVEGDRIYVRFANQSQVPLFIHLFDVGLSMRVAQLNASARSGYELAPGESWCFGGQPGLKPVGAALGWPDLTPRDGARLETLIAIISDKPLDLSVLEGNCLPARGCGKSLLEQTIFRKCIGSRRSGQHQTTDVCYAVKRLDFELAPKNIGMID